MAPVIGLGMSEERDHLAPVQNAHGFSIEWLKIPSGGAVSRHRLACKQVLSVYQGSVELRLDDDVCFALHGTTDGWDSYAVPADTWRSLRNTGTTDAVLLLITPGDARKRITWSAEVVQAAASAGFAIDANGYVALKRFTDRSQR